MMNKINLSRLLKTLRPAFLICLAFIGVAALGMLINNQAFYKIFPIFQESLPSTDRENGYNWDVKHYAAMALVNQCTAFYPLWPLIIRSLFHPQTVDAAAYLFSFVSSLLFFCCVFILYPLFKEQLNRVVLTSILLLAYALNPVSLFFAIGYTESLFALLATVLLWVLVKWHNFNQFIAVGLVGIITLLTSLTRPVLIQLLFASGASLITVIIFEIIKNESPYNFLILGTQKKYIQQGKITLTIWTSAILGYSLYGIFCDRSRGDFFAPFHDQKIWGKQLGLHLELLLLPKSFLFDFLGLWFPWIILSVSLAIAFVSIKNKAPSLWMPKSALSYVLLLYPPLPLGLLILSCLNKKLRKVFGKIGYLKKIKHPENVEALSKNYIFWFCIYFSVANSLIVFLTQTNLHSLARYVFAVPFFFLAVGYLCRCLPGKRIYKILWWFVFISAIDLVQEWIRYGNNHWIG